LADLQAAGFEQVAKTYGVHLAGALNAGYDDKVFYDSPLLGRLLSGDLEFGASEDVLARKSHVSKLVSQKLTKIINISPILNNNSAGVAGNLYGLVLGSVDNTRRFEGNTDALARAIPEIYALQAVGDRVVLNITDALVCQFEGGDNVRLHNSTVLNEIRLSRDPVALDVLSVNELEGQRLQGGFPAANTNCFDIYRNAALLELGVDDTKRIHATLLK
jgi:hypothetical protein